MKIGRLRPTTDGPALTLVGPNGARPASYRSEPIALVEAQNEALAARKEGRWLVLDGDDVLYVVVRDEHGIVTTHPT